MKPIIFKLLLIFLLIPPASVVAQEDFPSIKNWVKIIENKADVDFKELFALNQEFEKLDPTSLNLALKRIGELGPKNDSYFLVRQKYLFVYSKVRSNYPEGLEQVISLFDELIQEAYLAGDDLLTAHCYSAFGKVMYAYNQFDLAVSYSLAAIDLREKRLDPKNLCLDYIHLGEILFHTRDYPNSVKYTLRGLDLGQVPDDESSQYIRHLNTLGQGYFQLNKLDSAIYYFDASFKRAKLIDNQIWMGINSSYLGQVNFLKGDFQKSKSQLLFDYQINRYHEYNIAANSLQWLSKIYMENSNLDSAKLLIDESVSLLKKMENKIGLQTSNYLEQAFYLKSEIFKKGNRLDSALYYYKLYSELHNTNERTALLSSNQVTKTKVSNEKNRYALLTIQQEIAEEEKIRNILIISILVLTIVSGLLLIFKQKQLKYKNEIFRLQKAAADNDLNQAKDQIGFFTTKLLEKATLLENLENKLIEREFSEERQQYLTELSNQKILTEEDWQKFKGLFEKLNPGFFIVLKEKFPEITLAEQRLAALIRLQLTTKEMASILGISEASALRTRSRLKFRLNLNPEINLEDYLIGL